MIRALIAVALPAAVLACAAIGAWRDHRRAPVPASLVQRALAAPIAAAADAEIAQALDAVREAHGIENCCEVTIGPDGGLWWRPCGRHALPEATWRAWEDQLRRTP